mmetsp:Transcript_102039/g.295260  ORF Transcript_102039/g.295260 Transcript_102039/m.295260 type:complete len:402 (+) Transcript_102039:357-1562(+)
MDIVFDGLVNSGDNELRLTIRSVLAVTVDTVVDSRVFESLLDGLPVCLGGGLGKFGNAGADFRSFQSVQEGSNDGVLHGFVDIFNTQQSGRVAKRGMSSVQNSQLSQLIGGDVGNELDTNLLNGRALSVDEIVFNNILSERLAEDGVGILELVFGFHVFDFLGSSSRDDSVNHTVGEGHIFLDPLGKVFILKSGKVADNLFGTVTIVGNVITAKDGEGVGSSISSLSKSLDDNTNDRHGLVRVSNIVLDVATSLVQAARSRADVVTTLSDTGGADLDFRIQELFLDRSELRVERKKFEQRPDNTGVGAFTITSDDGVKHILLFESFLSLRVAAVCHTGTYNTPRMLFFRLLVEKFIEVVTKVATVKVSYTNVQKSGRDILGVILRNANRRRRRQVSECCFV